MYVPGRLTPGGTGPFGDKKVTPGETNWGQTFAAFPTFGAKRHEKTPFSHGKRRLSGGGRPHPRIPPKATPHAFCIPQGGLEVKTKRDAEGCPSASTIERSWFSAGEKVINVKAEATNQKEGKLAGGDFGVLKGTCDVALGVDGKMPGYGYLTWARFSQRRTGPCHGRSPGK